MRTRLGGGRSSMGSRTVGAKRIRLVVSSYNQIFNEHLRHRIHSTRSASLLCSTAVDPPRQTGIKEEKQDLVK
jgi:hypothetical protein